MDGVIEMADDGAFDIPATAVGEFLQATGEQCGDKCGNILTDTVAKPDAKSAAEVRNVAVA